jgi:hypothetical protein
MGESKIKLFKHLEWRFNQKELLAAVNTQNNCQLKLKLFRMTDGISF